MVEYGFLGKEEEKLRVGVFIIYFMFFYVLGLKVLFFWSLYVNVKEYI